MPIINLNTRSGVTSYALVQFVDEYLHPNRLELVRNKINTHGQLKEAVSVRLELMAILVDELKLAQNQL